jgi:predicted acyl esterase
VEEAPDDLVKHHDVPVPMRHGVILRVNVYRPAGEGPWPVLLAAHPYGKDRLPRKTRLGWRINPQFRILRQTAPFTISSETSWEAPDPVWWTGQGYAVVNADLRGAGTSDGVGVPFSAQEAEDIHDLIEWAGTQPWSSGKVGMLGVSYLAIAQYKAAALHPPHLAAICPWEGFTDAYRDLFTPGGIVENGFSRLWQTILRRTTRTTLDLAAERKRHPLRDDWWQALVPDLAAIEVPCLVCTSFSDHNLHSVGSFRAFTHIGSMEKFTYTHRGGKWVTFYSPQAKKVQLQFFDRYLKGLDVPRLPPVHLEVQRSRSAVASVRAEQEWPLARMRPTALFLSPDGRLIQGRPETAGEITFEANREAAAFTNVFPDASEIVGPARLDLWVSVANADDATLFVALEKWSGGRPVPFEGSYGYGRDWLSSGWQRLSLRDIDEVESTALQPVRSFTHRQPLAPGEIVPVSIPLAPSATHFAAGDAVRLLVGGRNLSPRNPFFGSLPASYVADRQSRITLHWGPQYPAAATLPFVPPTPTTEGSACPSGPVASPK